jgi:hypothetical protein
VGRIPVRIPQETVRGHKKREQSNLNLAEMRNESYGFQEICHHSGCFSRSRADSSAGFISERYGDIG